MAIRRLKVRRPFSVLPDWVWALAIDAIDLVSNVVSTILLAAFGVGLGLDLLVDAIQGFLALLIFEDVSIAILGAAADAPIPPPLDVFPTFSAIVWAKKFKIF